MLKQRKYQELKALKGLMREKAFTYRGLAVEMKVSVNALNNKINGYSAMNAEEIMKLVDILAISPNDVNKYFFPGLLRKAI
jgi:transcriptional regulator with XRE-family HTH domain